MMVEVDAQEGPKNLGIEVYQAFFKNCPSGVLIADDNSNYIDVNPKACEIFATSRDKILNMKLTDFVAPEKITLSEEQWKNFKELDEMSGEFELVRPSGEPRIIFFRAYSNFVPHLHLSVIEDITEFSRNREELKLLTERNNLLIETMAQGVVHQDANGKIISMNPAAERIIGKTQSELSEANLETIQKNTIREDGSVFPSYEYPSMQALRIGATVKSVVMGVYNPLEKQYRWIDITAVPLFESQDKIANQVYSVFEDITEKRMKEQALIAAKSEAATAIKKMKFLDIAAHELRTPVTAISLIVQLIDREIAKGNAFNPVFFERLKDSVSRMNKLVVDLLDLSRIERKLMNLQVEKTNLGEIISKCVSDFQLIAPKRVFIFKESYEPIFMEIDPLRINQVLSNLLDNAVKYTPDVTPIEITVQIGSESVRVSVIDQGAGVSKEQQANLFTPFSRGTSDVTSHTSGLGLGLSVCQGIIDLHGGKMGFTSEENKGSTFYFELPRRSLIV